MVQLRLVPMTIVAVLAAAAAAPLWAADVPARKIDPTFLRRYIPDVPPKTMDFTSDSCQYKPLFGAGDSDSSIVRGVGHFGELSIAPSGSCKPVNYPAEEQVYVIMEGSGHLHYGPETAAVKKHDFMYLPAGVEHSLPNPFTESYRL